MQPIERGTVVVLAHNRRARLLQTLRALQQLPERWPVIVVDNGSSDGTAKAVSLEFPAVMLIRSRRNIGAAARNIAVAYAHTPYIAFCDADTCWLPGALQRAAGIMDANNKVGVVSGRIVESESGKVDPACTAMARSPLERENLPGPQILDFKTEGSVIRTRAFYEAGGFWPPFFSGGEEALMALDMADRGWRMVYMEDIITRRAPSVSRHRESELRRELRNAIWTAWMRLPLGLAWRETLEQLRTAARRHQLRPVLIAVASGMARILRRRHVITPRVASMWHRLYQPTVSPSSQHPSTPSRRSAV